MVKYQKDNELMYGFNSIVKEHDHAEQMMMDFDVYKGKNEVLCLREKEKEIAVILFSGKIQLIWENKNAIVERKDVFEDGPYVLHVSKDVEIQIKFLLESEIGIQRATNEKKFESKLYLPTDCKEQCVGEKIVGGTAKRIIRDIFKYDNAPYSNLVMGEVITFPGKWSSYPPHYHEQPEVYFYKFTKKQGFGAGYVGDDVFKLKENSALLIAGGKSHPQVAAPGYGMYYCWMIRNLPDNPWLERVDEEEHKWLFDENAEIWSKD